MFNHKSKSLVLFFSTSHLVLFTFTSSNIILSKLTTPSYWLRINERQYGHKTVSNASNPVQPTSCHLCSDGTHTEHSLCNELYCRPRWKLFLDQFSIFKKTSVGVQELKASNEKVDICNITTSRIKVASKRARTSYTDMTKTKCSCFFV